jgi:hypothetical protein
MINKLTQEQIVDAFAKYQPHVELELPLDPVVCLWFYYTMDELETQLQNMLKPGDVPDKAKYDSFMWLDKVVRQRRDAWIDYNTTSDIKYTDPTAP